MATTLEMLLAQLAAQNGGGPGLPPSAPSLPVPLIAPTGNVPEYGGPSMVTEPPQAPPDPRILAQYLAAGQQQAPQAPAPLSKGQRIANALIGFGAGVQGYGPQFLQQLQEPQREYQRQLERFNNQRADLRLEGVKAQLRDQENRTRRAQEVSDQQFQAEVNREARRLHLTDQREFALFQDALAARRQREKAERDAAEADKRRREKQEDDARTIAGHLGTGAGAAPAAIAKELGRYYANLTDSLSPAAEKWRNAQAKRADILASRTPGGGGGASSKAMKVAQEIENVKDKMIEAEATTDNPALKQQLRVKLNNLFRRAASFPELRFGLQGNKWPWVLVNGQSVRAEGQQQQAAPQGQMADPLGIR